MVNAENLYWELSEIHTWARHHFVYVPDTVKWKEGHNFGEHWETREELEKDLTTKGFVEGDCDAFAMMCWMACRKSNIKARLVFCLAENREGHLVCEASGWILDNRQQVVVDREDLSKSGYIFISKSGYEPGEQWTTAE